jgi:hypothetical protein
MTFISKTKEETVSSKSQQQNQSVVQETPTIHSARICAPPSPTKHNKKIKKTKTTSNAVNKRERKN